MDQSPPQNAGKARDKVGADFKVSGRMVDQATRVRENAIPKVVEAVEAGDISLNEADRIQRESEDEEEQLAELAKSKKPKPKRKQKPKVEQRGKGLIRANEAIDKLNSIPKKDAFRSEGFKRVADWIKEHK